MTSIIKFTKFTRCYFILNSSSVSQAIDRSSEAFCVRFYSKQTDGDKCRRAIVDIPPKVDPDCPLTCERRKKKEGILHKIKLKVIEGGTNFGTPFRRLACFKRKGDKDEEESKIAKIKTEPEPKALVQKVKERKTVIPMPEPRPGVQVSILGADTRVGQYVALLLKQCSCIKKLRLYEAKDTQCCPCNRDLCNVVHDLQHINTNCLVQMFRCACFDLERCLQSTDIVLMLDSGNLNVNTSLEERFCNQAPIVKRYADAIATECPQAFVIVCATPVDCMVPLIAETFKQSGWYDPCKLMGSLAVPEMRASTLAARALCLEPRYTRVPCVGGTEDESLVPLFSKAVEYFDFSQYSAEMMTQTIRDAPSAVATTYGQCTRTADLSEAHALAGLVTKVAHAILCADVPRVTGFVETDATQIISPARYIANQVEIRGGRVVKNFGLPKMNDLEATYLNLALSELTYKLRLVDDWYNKYYNSLERMDARKLFFFEPKILPRFDDCAYGNVFLSIEVLLKNNGICKKFDLPRMSEWERDLMDLAFMQLTSNVRLAQEWLFAKNAEEIVKYQMTKQKQWQWQRHYEHVDECVSHLA